MDRKKLIQPLIYLIFLILLVNFLANQFYWYYSIWYLDMIMHFLGGFWVGLASVYLFPLKNNVTATYVFKILIFVLLVGLGWEIYEVLVNDIIAQNPFNFLDTLSDIFFDLSGGLCAILYVLVPFKNQRTGSKE